MQIQGEEPAVFAPQSLSRSPQMKRRDLIRWSVFASVLPALGPAFSLAQAISSDLTPAARGEDGSRFLSDPGWKPVFLNVRQNETLNVLSDVIIPVTDTPGAKQALVNRYLDLLLSVQPAAFQQQFVDALAFLDGESQRQFAKDFRVLAPDDRISLLTPWAYAQRLTWGMEHNENPEPGYQHFQRLKALVAAAYYGSEIGQKELGWDGAFTHGPYQGCEHPTTDHV